MTSPEWENATEEEILSYVPERPGYLPSGKKIIGYDEVTLHHIAALAQDLWGERVIANKGGQLPSPQNRKGKPKGKWRKRKDIHLECSEPHWYMTVFAVTGWKVSTRNKREDE